MLSVNFTSSSQGDFADNGVN